MIDQQRDKISLFIIVICFIVNCFSPFRTIKAISEDAPIIVEILVGNTDKNCMVAAEFIELAQKE